MRRGGYAYVPNWLVRSRTISRQAKAVYATLASHAGDKSTTYVAVALIAEESGYGETMVRRALKELRDLGIVTWRERFTTERRQTSNLYRLDTTEPAAHKAGGVHIVKGGGSHSEDEESPSKNQEQLLAPPPAVRPPRPRDPIWDSVVAACDIVDAQLTRSGKGAVAKAVAELKAVGATPDEIRAKAAQWPRTFPGAQLTAPALAKHWAGLGRGSGQAIDVYAALR